MKGMTKGKSGFKSPVKSNLTGKMPKMSKGRKI